jgi:hypothetical protein
MFVEDEALLLMMLELHESGTFVRFVQVGVRLFA